MVTKKQILRRLGGLLFDVSGRHPAGRDPRGGAAVLAHPACYWAINLDHFVKTLIDLGLDGIESYYPYRRHRGIIKFHTAEAVRRIARKYNLIMTGGSDSHGVIESIFH